MGKRRTINQMVRNTESEIIVSVDSDVVVDRQAVRKLVARSLDETSLGSALLKEHLMARSRLLPIAAASD
jgi:cellulose synthase/poly-beta-1,6-N-acetylglucosamine synthase-like glycosyltransferase